MDPSPARPTTPKQPWGTKTPILLGHRGAPRSAPENTDAAFRAALEAGLDGLETDLQRTRDGVLVLSHDPYLAREPGHAHEFIATLDDLALRDRIPAMPRLTELREVLADYPQALLNLELKTDAPFGDARAQELVTELASWPDQLTQRLWISTFDPVQLLRLAEAGVAVPLAFLAFEVGALALLPSLPIAAVHPHHSLVTAERMADWHERQLAVFVWTVNDAALAERLLALGADGLIGDVPELLIAARRSTGRSDQQSTV